LEDLEAVNRELAGRVKKLDEALFVAQQDNIRLKKNCFEANEQMFEATLKFDTLQRETQTRDELTQQQQRDLQASLAETARALERAQVEVTPLAKEKAQWTQAEAQYKTALRELDRQLASLEQDMQTDQREFVQRIRGMEEEARLKQNPDLDRAMKEIDRLEAQLHELQIHMNKGADKRHIEPLQAIINSLTVQVTELTEENQKLTATVAELRRTLVDKEVRMGMLEEAPPPRPSKSQPADLSKTPPAQLIEMIRGLREENQATGEYLDRILSQIMMRVDLLYLLQMK